jgi:hypothetical protein
MIVCHGDGAREPIETAGLDLSTDDWMLTDYADFQAAPETLGY